MLVILDRAHIGKPGRHDLGAGADLDGDGLVEVHEREAMLTPTYIGAAQCYLEARGHEVIVVEAGTYAERQRAAAVWAAEYQGPVAYVSCHLNAGGGSYGLTIHDHRSSMGRRMAEHVAGALGELLLEGVDRVVIGATKPGETWPRAWGCIKDIYPGPTNIAACLFEPLFLDNHEHQQWLNDAGLEAIGFKLGEALIRWGHGDQTC